MFGDGIGGGDRICTCSCCIGDTEDTLTGRGCVGCVGCVGCAGSCGTGDIDDFRGEASAALLRPATGLRLYFEVGTIGTAAVGMAAFRSDEKDECEDKGRGGSMATSSLGDISFADKGWPGIE